MTSLQPQCMWCGVGSPSVELSPCSRCQVAQYCSAEHQAIDFENHVMICKSVKTTRDALAREERKRIHHATAVYPAHEVLPVAASLLDAKRAHVQRLANVSSPLAVTLALTEALDSLRLNPRDKLRVADGVPTLMLLLGKTQDAYDFIKAWTAVCEPYGSRDMTRTFREIHGADLTEPIDEFRDRKTAFILAPLTWIKLQAARQIGDVIRSRLLVVDHHTSLPPLAVGTIRELLWGAPLESSHEQLRRGLDEWKQLRKSLVAQAMELFKLANKANPTYWQAMLDPIAFLEADPYTYLGEYRTLLKPWLLPSVQLWSISPVFIQTQLDALRPQDKEPYD